MLKKIIILFILVSAPLQARASDEKGWYSFIQNKGWYPFQGQPGSSASSTPSGDQQPLVQPTAQPGVSTTSSTTNTSSQVSTQPGQSNWFKE